jgi:hypothetical protein
MEVSGQLHVVVTVLLGESAPGDKSIGGGGGMVDRRVVQDAL